MARPLSQHARQKAIDAAISMVADTGISGVTMDGVAKLSGVAKTTLYRHWKSGSELLVDALDCTIESVPTPDTGSLRGDLRAMATTIVSIANQPGNRRLIFDMLSAAAADPELAAVHHAMVQERMRPLHQILERAIERQEIQPTDLNLASLFIEGPFMSMMAMSAEPLDEAIIDPLVELWAAGLGAHP